jgi:transposase-like protein
LELTPGEVRAAYYELNRQITVHLDSFVGKIVDATEDFKNLIVPLLDQMQSLLSERGSRRKLLNTAGVETWEEWFEDFERRLHLDITFRTIQRWLKQYRLEKGEEPPAKDGNVTAKEYIRNVESKKQAEKRESVVKERKQLNPAIHVDLIRALKARVKTDLAMIATLEEDFKPLNTSTGKALQHLMRQRRAKFPDPLLEEKKKLAADFTHARVERISYAEARNVILRSEYLGSMGSVSGKFCYGLFFGDHLGSVACFGTTAGTHVAASVCGPEHAKEVKVLVRGATEPWHTNIRLHI